MRLVRQVSELNDAQLDSLTTWFDALWWTSDRSRADVERMVSGSVIVGFVDEDDQLVAFARAITDGVFKALILDVVVDEAKRGTGLGLRLMEAIASHSGVANCRHLELYCAPDMIPYYEKFGYTAELGTLTFMRADRTVAPSC